MAEFREEKHNLTYHVANLLTNSPPTVQLQLLVILKSLSNQEAVIEKDRKGRPVISYKDDQELKFSRNIYEENTVINPKSTQDMGLSVEGCLKTIEYFKKTKAPSGVVINDSKIHTTTGEYRENVHFEKEKNTLGSGNNGCIFPTKDKFTEAEHAQKIIMIENFRSEEIEAWVDLSMKGLAHAFPELYMFQIDRNKVVIHMEKLENALTLNDVKGRVKYILDTNAALLKPFCLYIFLNLLEELHSMHEKGWTHGDIHDRNVVIQKKSGSLKVKLLDLGDACNTDSMDEKTRRKKDVLDALRMFSGLYLGEEFCDPQDLKSRWINILFKKMKEQLKSEDERGKMATLFRFTDLFKIDELMQHVKEMIDEESGTDWMKEILRILFQENFDQAQNTDETCRDLISSEMVSIRM